MSEPEISIECDGEDMFVVRNGRKIARRVERQWQSMAPGFTVSVADDGGSIIIDIDAARVAAH